MTASGHLIRTQEDVADGGTMADIAAEAAAEAAARSEIIRQETQKLSEKIESPHTRHREDKKANSNNRHEAQSPEHDVQDIRARSIHQLDLSDRLPWMKGLGKTENQRRIDEEDTQREQERLTSPDSGVIDQLSEATESLDGHTPIHAVSSPPHSAALKRQERMKDYDEMILALVPPPSLEDDQLPSHLQNALLEPGLPPKDYPILQPPKDYPALSQHTTSPLATKMDNSNFDTNPAGDVYTVQEVKLNSSCSNGTSRTTGSSPSTFRPQKSGGKLSSKSSSNLLTTDSSYAQNGPFH